MHLTFASRTKTYTGLIKNLGLANSMSVRDDMQVYDLLAAPHLIIMPAGSRRTHCSPLTANRKPKTENRLGLDADCVQAGDIATGCATDNKDVHLDCPNSDHPKVGQIGFHAGTNQF